MALMLLIDKHTKAIKNDDYVIGKLLDFSKAFHIVNHYILLKMDHHGIRGSALGRFESYLTNRQHYVTFSGVKSSCKTIKCGVYRVYTCSTALSVLFVDDTTVEKTLRYYKIYLMKSWRKFRSGLKSINCPLMSKRPMHYKVIWLKKSLVKLGCVHRRKTELETPYQWCMYLGKYQGVLESFWRLESYWILTL